MANKVNDPVCGMEIDPKTAAGSSTYDGETYYYFGSAACEKNVDRSPDKYAKKI